MSSERRLRLVSKVSPGLDGSSASAELRGRRPMIGYYDYFPPKRMNVSVQSGAGEGSQTMKKILVAERDFAEGEVIYTVMTHPSIMPL